MSAVMADPATGDAPVARRPKKKLIVIGAAVLVLVLALGAGTVVFLKQRAAHAAAAAAGDDEGTDHAGSARIDPKNVPIYLPLDPFVVNLADKEADRYAQIGITLELDNGVSADQIKAYMPAIRNAILLILANKSSKDLLNREGKEQLAQDIMREAVRPMGIEPASPEPVTATPTTPAMTAAAASAAEGASAPASGGAAAGASAIAVEATAKPKPRRRAEGQRNPIQHVHFSSFIIQ